MTVRRVMGIETEYGVLEPGRAYANPMLLSSHVVAAYTTVTEGESHPRWDYTDEDPLADARGFRLDRASAHPSMLTDDPARPAPSGDAGPQGEAGPDRDGLGVEMTSMPRPLRSDREDPSAATSVLTNGARLYVDHAHPEYASPEVTNPRDAVIWDKAGERVMLAAVRALASTAGMPDVVLYKNNVDGKGASYGTHENYLVQRDLPFATLVQGLTPFLVTRQVFAGAGRVGLGQTGGTPGFQLSQRADYIEAEVGLETTLRRPIVNTRDEPHADRTRWRRLHLILGDATMLEVATYLRVGTTALMLWLLEQAGPRVQATLAGLAMVDPVAAVHQVSRDPTLTARVELVDGRRLTALQIQAECLAAVRSALAEQDEVDEATAQVVDRWASVIDRLGTDPASCSREVEWVAKLRVLEGMRRRDHLAWDHPRLAAMDIQWSDVRPERGLYHRLAAAGAVELLVTDEEVADAVTMPPQDTRAYFRGTVLRRFGSSVRSASWDAVVLDVPSLPTLQRIPLRDPWLGTRAHVGELLDMSPDVASLVENLTGG